MTLSFELRLVSVVAFADTDFDVDLEVCFIKTSSFTVYVISPAAFVEDVLSDEELAGH